MQKKEIEILLKKKLQKFFFSITIFFWGRGGNHLKHVEMQKKKIQIYFRNPSRSFSVIQFTNKHTNKQTNKQKGVKTVTSDLRWRRLKREKKLRFTTDLWKPSFSVEHTRNIRGKPADIATSILFLHEQFPCACLAASIGMTFFKICLSHKATHPWQCLITMHHTWCNKKNNRDLTELHVCSLFLSHHSFTFLDVIW